MGLLKKISLYILVILFIGGCASSVIKLESYKDDFPYSQYGQTAQREFFSHAVLNMELNEKWESSINGGFTNSSITIYDSAVFVNDLSGRLYCFSIKNGKTLGQLKYKGSVFTSPIIYNTMLIFALVNIGENTSNLYFYDFKAGKEISSVELDGRVTNQLLKIEDGVLALTENGQLSKYDFNANLLWQIETDSYCHSNPASNNKFVFFGNDKGEIISVDANNGKLIYRKKIGNPFFCGTTIFGDIVYIGNDDGKLYSIDLSSGSVNWSFQTNAMIRMEAAVNDNEVYIGNLKGEFYKLSKIDGKQIWKIETEGLLNITPLLTKNVVTLPDANKQLYFISCDTGKIINSITVDGRMKLSPVIKNDLLFIGYDNGNLRAYEIGR